VEGGQDRARPTGRPESVEELLARHGAPPTGSRAARRRAAEEVAAPDPGDATATIRPGPPGAGPARFPAGRPPDRRSEARRGAGDTGRRHAGGPAAPAGQNPSRPAVAARRGPAAAGPGTPTGRRALGPSGSPAGTTDASTRFGPTSRTPPRPALDAPTVAVRTPTARTAGNPARPSRDDIGTGAQDVSEQAERTRRTERTGAVDVRSQRIDETLTRLTAAHAGLVLPGRDRAAGEPSRSGRRPNAARLLVLVLAVAVLATTAAGWAAQRWLGSAVRTVAALDEDSGAIRDAEAQQGDRNVLVVATDTAPATVAVAHVPAGGGPLVVLAVPADLEVSRPPCERFDLAAGGYTDEIVPALGRTQLATALAEGGPRCVTRVVQQLTGLAISAYVGVDIDRIGALVDAVSGVRVCVTRPVQDRELGPVVPGAGAVTLDGARAGDFVRAADVDGDPPADRGRIQRQQQVLAGVLDPTLSTTGLLDLSRVAALRPALGAALTTDGAAIDDVLALALSLRALDADGVSFVPVPTTTGSRGAAVLRDADAAALFSALRTHAPLPAGGEAATGPNPGDMMVQVLNASGRTGVAAKTGDTLRSLGFGVGTVSNADQPTPQTVIRYSPDQAAAADLLAGSVPAASLVPDPGSTGILQLVLGRSFDGDVRPPSQPAAEQAAQVTTQSCT
jgi:LCP family protein required for cell wall assembly